MTKRNSWDQRGDEQAKHFQAFNDYLHMDQDERFSKRSISALLAFYREHGVSLLGEPVPTKRNGTIFEWSSRYEWLKRAGEYDAYQRKRATQEWEEERKRLIRWSNQKARENLQLVYQRFDEVAQTTRGAAVEDIVEEKTTDGGVRLRTVLRMVRSNVYQIRTLIRLADDVEQHRRRVLDMPTEIKKHINEEEGLNALMKRMEEALDDIEDLDEV